MYYLNPRIMTEVNVSATVGECLQQWVNVYNSGEIEYGLGNLRVEIVIHNSA